MVSKKSSNFAAFFYTMADQRQNIIETAWHLFQQYGIKSVSMDDICKELGMSKKTLYTYFGQKDDLVEAALGVARGSAQTKIEEMLLRQRTVWEYIMSLSETLSHMPDVRRIPPLVYDLNKYYPALAKKHNALVYEQNVKASQLLIQRGVDEGLFRTDLDVVLTAHLVARMHHNAIEDSVNKTDCSFPLKRVMDFTMDVFIRGILSADGLQKYEQLKLQLS